MSFTMRRPIPTDYDDYDSDHEMEPSEAPESEMLVDGAESVAGQSQAQSSLHPDDSLSQRGSRPLRYSRRYVEDMDTSDNQSVISFHSSVDGFLFKNYHGRAFSVSDMYLLPGDDTEHERLDMQHTVLKLLHDGLYISKPDVERALQRDQRLTPTVIDIGTGSGRWAVEMAHQFPWTEVVGLDLVPPALLDTARLPDNVRFEVDDANQPLDHYYNAFNVIHCRSCDGGIVDMHNFLYELARILRSDGVLLLIGGDTQAWDEHMQRVPSLSPGEPGFSWVQYAFDVCHKYHRKRGNFALEAAPQWTGWLNANPNYRDVRTEFFYIPLGKWKPGLSEAHQRMSELMAEDIQRIMIAFRPLFLGGGMEAQEADLIIQNAVQDLKEVRKRQYIRFRYTTAIRTDTPWQERPELPPM